MFLHVSVCPQGVVSQHALQVSGGGGCIPAHLAGFQAHTQGESLRGLASGGLQAHNWGGDSRPTPRGDVSQHALRQTPPQADGYCCGRYASYWNAFLFSLLARSESAYSFNKEVQKIWGTFWLFYYNQLIYLSVTSFYVPVCEHQRRDVMFLMFVNHKLSPILQPTSMG